MRCAGKNLTARLLGLDHTKETQKVHKHDTVREIETIDLATVLRNSSGGDNIVEIKPQRRVNIANKCLHTLLGTLI